MRRALKSIAQEISHSLVHEAEAGHLGEESTSSVMVDALTERLVAEVARELGTRPKTPSADDRLAARLTRLEARLNKLTGADHDDDDARGRSSLPNLKYAEPKYKDVQSVLKYIESDEDKGGLKLVIMNFND